MCTVCVVDPFASVLPRLVFFGVPFHVASDAIARTNLHTSFSSHTCMRNRKPAWFSRLHFVLAENKDMKKEIESSEREREMSGNADNAIARRKMSQFDSL